MLFVYSGICCPRTLSVTDLAHTSLKSKLPSNGVSMLSVSPRSVATCTAYADAAPKLSARKYVRARRPSVLAKRPVEP